MKNTAEWYNMKYSLSSDIKVKALEYHWITP